MRLMRSLLFDGILYGLMAVMGLVLAPAAALSRPAARWSIRVYCRIVLAILRPVCGLRAEIRGQVPSGRVLVVAKHQSFLDVLILSAVLPHPQFVMKDELRRTPVLGWYALRIGCVPVKRERGGRALKDMVAEIDAGGVEGQLVIYPQGTRVAPGAVARYRPGAAALYGRFGLQAVPMATNSGVFWGRRSLIRHPGTAVVEFLDPLPPGLPAGAFMDAVETRIEAASDALIAEARVGFDRGS